MNSPRPPEPDATPARPAPPWAAVKALFGELVDLAPPQRRAALQRAAVDTALADEVWALLGQHDAEATQAGPPAAPGLDADARPGFLARPALAAVAAPRPPAGQAGQRLGAWRLTHPLGRGGMGEVWAAERDDGAYEARAAVKLLPGGGPDPALLQHEQRVLARLAHPHIARLFDAGVSDDGHPYFVMEAVDGRPIDQACRGLPLQARLALFLQLADAVSHAHRQGLVHRDLKPANVLVDGDGQVKLLDFGIAQALAGVDIELPGDVAPLHAFTPGFASPEQVRGEPATAASDVYALGVLLHLVVTGVRPYGLASRGATTAAAVLRAVLEEPPTRPSQAPTEPDADPGVPRRQLAGDLDAIVLKALAKPVAGRYGSVQAMADDVRALCARQPVSARPHTPLYVAGRFVSRHRGTVAASLLALLALTAALAASAWRTRDGLALLALAALAGALAFSSWQARRAALARDEAQAQLAQTSSLVRDVLMRYADMATFLPGGLQLKADLLRDALAHLERLHVSAPHDGLLAAERAKAHARLAELLLPGRDTTLDDAEAARVHAERALALFPAGEAAALGDPDFAMWWARCLGVRARLHQQAGDPRAARDLVLRERRYLEGALRRFPRQPQLLQELGSSLLVLGQLHQTWIDASLGDAPQALAHFEQARALFEQHLAGSPDDGDAWFQLGTVAGSRLIVLRQQGRLHEAAEAGREAVRCRARALALKPLHTSYREGLAGEGNNLAMVLLELGGAAAVQEALDVTARGEALMQALEAEDPAVATWTQRRRWFALHRGRALRAAGQAAEALPRLQEALRAMEAVQQGPGLVRRAWCELELAQALQTLAREAEARALAADARAHLLRRLSERAPGAAPEPDTLARVREFDAAFGTALGALGPSAAPGAPGAAPSGPRA